MGKKVNRFFNEPSRQATQFDKMTKADMFDCLLELHAMVNECQVGNELLYSYCASNKFQGARPIDRMINKDDIFLRLNETKHNASLHNSLVNLEEL